MVFISLLLSFIFVIALPAWIADTKMRAFQYAAAMGFAIAFAVNLMTGYGLGLSVVAAGAQAGFNGLLALVMFTLLSSATLLRNQGRAMALFRRASTSTPD